MVRGYSVFVPSASAVLSASAESCASASSCVSESASAAGWLSSLIVSESALSAAKAAGAAIPDSRRGGVAYPARRGAAILHLHPQPGGKRAGSRTVPAGKSGVLPADAAAGGLFRGGGQADGAYLDAVPAYASYGRVLPGGLCSVGRPFFIKNGWCA